MKAFFVRVASIAVASTSLLAPAIPALAISVESVASRPNFAGSVGQWEVSGGPSVLSDGRVILRESGNQKMFLSRDVSLSDNDGNYAVFIAYTKAQRIDNRGNANAMDITGLPYLYGYLMDGTRIRTYMQGQEMRHDAGTENVWAISYGVFSLPSGTDTARLFLKQAERRGSVKGNLEAWFYRPGFYVVDRPADALTVVEWYRSRLSDIPASLSTVTSAPAPRPNPSGDTCAPLNGELVLRTAFEPGVGIDARFRFGALISSWTSSVHDYSSGTSVANTLTSTQSYDGFQSLGLSNASYGQDNGRERTAPYLYDEAVGYDVTNLFSEGEWYRVSMRMKFINGGSSVPVTIAKETRGTQSYSAITQSYSTPVGSEWKCVYLDVRQGPRSLYGNVTQPTAEDVTLFFGNVPKSTRLFIDDARVTRL
ncbi:hypothetical protein HYW18_03710 [Candidatus Uhrbacteria bacterium]|nr:hypothetical protein [Candidatus Uhrbacteria bacterium]